MIKRTLYFSNPAYLNLKDKQLQIDLPHLKNLGEKGRVNVINNYTVEQMCSKTLEIYKSLV